MNSTAVLKQRVEARDRLLLQAENVSQRLGDQVLGAFARGEIDAAEQAAREHDAQLRELTENLRIYQAELHAQADELATSHAHTEAMVRRFGALFANMPLACMLVTFNGEVLEHNAMAAHLLGLRPTKQATRFMHRLIDSADYQDRVRPAFHQAQTAGISAMDHIGFFGEGGRHFAGELHLSHLPAGTGGAQSGGQFVCAVIDRTEHIEDLGALAAAAEALRKSEASLATAARLARTGGWELNLHPRLLHGSVELRSLLELPAGAPATLDTLLACCAPHDRAAFAQAVEAAAGGQDFEIEIDMASAGGRPMRVLAVGRAEVEGEVVTRVSGMLQDITSQHQVRQQLGDLKERLAIANEAGGIGVWDWDLVQGGLVFDPQLCRLLGLATQPPERTLDEALAPCLHPAALAPLRSALAAASQSHQPLNLELRLRRNADDVGGAAAGDGRERWLHLSGRVCPDARGRNVRMVGCAWDSSPQHQALQMLAAKDAAESASRAKSAFLSRMSHELRTPLNAVLGFAQLMRMDAQAGDLQLKPHRVELIESAARHLLELVNEVLDVSRIESGQLELHVGAFELRPLIAESLALVQEAAEQNGVALVDLSATDARCDVQADRLRLKEVLINLLSNAVKYNRRGGRVQITTLPGTDHVELQVRDTGRGLSAQQLADLFQPFNRVGAEATAIEGSGMGLFVSRRFVELMGGRIDVESEVGVGTCVRVRLPLPLPLPSPSPSPSLLRD